VQDVLRRCELLHTLVRPRLIRRGGYERRLFLVGQRTVPFLPS
jgi:hypothetical protein